MTCEELQHLILTDYMDGEVDEVLAAQIEKHIESCETCREFLIAVESSSVKPLAHTPHTQPSASVWAKIKDEITESDIEQESSFAYVFSQIGKFLNELKVPAFALATVVAIVIGVTLSQMVTRDDAPMASIDAEEVEYLVSLIDEADEEDLGEYAEAIEEYFL